MASGILHPLTYAAMSNTRASLTTLASGNKPWNMMNTAEKILCVLTLGLYSPKVDAGAREKLVSSMHEFHVTRQKDEGEKKRYQACFDDGTALRVIIQNNNDVRIDVIEKDMVKESCVFTGTTAHNIESVISEKAVQPITHRFPDLPASTFDSSEQIKETELNLIRQFSESDSPNEPNRYPTKDFGISVFKENIMPEAKANQSTFSSAILDLYRTLGGEEKCVILKIDDTEIPPKVQVKIRNYVFPEPPAPDLTNSHVMQPLTSDEFAQVLAQYEPPLNQEQTKSLKLTLTTPEGIMALAASAAQGVISDSYHCDNTITTSGEKMAVKVASLPISATNKYPDTYNSFNESGTFIAIKTNKDGGFSINRITYLWCIDVNAEAITVLKKFESTDIGMLKLQARLDIPHGVNTIQGLEDIQGGIISGNCLIFQESANSFG